ncbi:CHC2 zinc finger domain-containing protein [Methylocucumis oryzae]|uniref:CHC2 zinc finger domain-containing protein n=1 Tax=Methylocucumis oryzae TaxID=1632867 RepID=UPI00069850C9
MSKLDSFLASLDRVKRTGHNRWVGCCPNHSNKTPSLSSRLLDDDKILIHCFGSCWVDEVFRAIGLTLTDIVKNLPSKFNFLNFKNKTRSTVKAIFVHLTCCDLIPAKLTIWLIKVEGLRND